MWKVEISNEVGEWLRSLSDTDAATAYFRINRLATDGPALRMPHSKYLGQKLYELRFSLDNVNRRITYTFDEDTRVITLTTFRKQRQNEAREVTRARRALRRYHDNKENNR